MSLLAVAVPVLQNVALSVREKCLWRYNFFPAVSILPDHWYKLNTCLMGFLFGLLRIGVAGFYAQTYTC